MWLEHNQVNTTIRHILFRIAFVAADASGMERETRSAAGKSIEHSPLAWQAGAAAFQGQWHRSAEYARRAIDIAMRGDAREVAALYASEAALRSAVIGNCAEARGAAAQALSIAHSQESLPRAELAMELCGASAGAETQELMQRYPKHTILMSVWLPVLQAALDLKEGRDASAIERLKPTVAYEAAADFWPQYLRGQAYLRLQMGAESAAEFRKILDHRGQAVESVLYPMARLGLARAIALQGDRAQARQSYQALLADWKDADAETPPLVAARRELEQMK